MARAHQTLTIGSASVETAKCLGIPVNTPVADVRRTLNSEDGTLIYLAEIIYRGDVIRIETDLEM
jgi:GntR family transcriptional regulator